MALVYRSKEKEFINAFQTKQMQEFFSRLDEMRNDGIDTDIVLICEEDEKVKAHRWVLSTTSPYFKQIFEKDPTKNTVDLPHIKKHILNAVVNFLYMSSKYDMSKETFDHLLDIHELALLFKLNTLVELSWRLIMERMNVANCLVIWRIALLHSEPPEVKKIFLFILNNLPSVVQQNEFFNLEISELKLLLQKVNDKNCRTGDYLLEAVIDWMKFEKKRVNFLVELFFCFNFDFITDEKLKEVLSDEDSSFQNGFFNLLLQLQITPNLKLKRALEDVLENSNSQLSSTNVPPVLLFYFGSYKSYLANGKLDEELPAVWVIDAQNKFNVSFKVLPFKVNHQFLCTNYNSHFYFLDTNNSGTQSNGLFFCYNWSTNEIISKPSPPAKLSQCHMRSCSNRIYLIGIKTNGYLGILYFDISKQQWMTTSCTDYYCSNMYSVTSNNNNLYIFCYCTERWLFIVNNNSATLIYSKFPNASLKNSIVYRDVVYDFINPLYANCTFYLYKSPDPYKTLNAICNKPSSARCCFSTESNGIFFYSNNDEIFHFDENNYKITQLPFHYPFSENTQVINNKICSFGFEIMIACEKQSDVSQS